jgi:hypothetical protein
MLVKNQSIGGQAGVKTEELKLALDLPPGKNDRRTAKANGD